MQVPAANHVRALLAQLAPRAGSPHANAARAAEIVGAAGAPLVVFPELYLSGYDLRRVKESSVEPDSPELGEIRTAAARARAAVAVGFAERRGSSVANSVALIDEHGELAAVYRKIQLFGEELNAFTAGEELLVVKLAGRRVGALVCFDMEFPEHARALASAGADLLVTVAANMEPFFDDHRLASRARALDNRIPHLYCNRCGEEAGLRFVGGTRSVRADGSIEGEATSADEELLAVAAGGTGADDNRVDYLAHLREEIGVKAPMAATGGSR